MGRSWCSFRAHVFWVAVGFVWDCLFTVILLVFNNCLFFFSSFTMMAVKLVVVILGGYKVNE